MNTHIYLYGPESETIDLREIREYLLEKFPFQIKIRDNIFSSSPEHTEFLAKELAKCRVRDICKKISDFEPLYGEIEFEKRVLTGKSRVLGVLYDGLDLSALIRKIIPTEELHVSNLHLVFTDRLIATLQDRYHARIVILGIPVVISITGMIEAPAKPKEYYIAKQKLAPFGIPPETIKDQFKGRFIDYEDERLTEIAKGYVMQGIVYHFTHEAFCENKDCRLYNAHWQEDMIHAQTSDPEFCERHKKIIEKIATGRYEGN
jgi:hypothetical protein